ncbi:hypothetical protein [Rhizobium sp. L1K21]|uniref:hypothetical protein n=1 Tax=Rhizobium sp. L1K21 TaxID=2954933 RepID=UPI002092BC82|nr:hypothetical protein [Rhizobium sp. L1K21]MCO6188579.1 hypothetical protein [Rhizobium sp. L1K21]
MVREIPPKKARQGGTSRRVLIVLVVSLVAAFAVWGIAELYYYGAMAPGPQANEAGESL